MKRSSKQRLSKKARRSKASLSAAAGEATAVCAARFESEQWQLGEIHAGIAEADAGNVLSHEKVTKWLKSWGTARETTRAQI